MVRQLLPGGHVREELDDALVPSLTVEARREHRIAEFHWHTARQVIEMNNLKTLGPANTSQLDGPDHQVDRNRRQCDRRPYRDDNPFFASTSLHFPVHATAIQAN